MADTKYSLGHSRKPKGRVGVGGQPVQSWDDGIELQPTTSLGSVTAAQNTSVGAKDNRHAVAQTWATKQAFTHRKKEREPSFGTILSKNSPVKVSVSGEWALQECEEFTNWANVLLKKGRYRSITDIRKSIGDGQTLVHILEVLAGQKIPGVYARPVTKAQKLENLQLCMSFMGNRDINLQGIYVGDLIDGNLNSILSLCGNLQKKFEGWQAHTPESKRPYSSDSTKQNGRLMNGHVNHNMKDYDVDTNKPHGSSSGYHSEEYSPTRVTSNISLQMPGMMTDPHSPHHITNTINPSDVIVSTTKLDSKSVYQSGYEQRKNQNVSIPHQQEMDSDVISPSVEERLRSLLNTPNPGGLEEETDDELMIPPPRRRSDVQEDESFDVEERLKSLLDYDVDGFSEEEYDDDMDEDTKGVDALNKLDAIGYMPSHPSEKMRNISPTQKRQDSFTGRSRLRTAKLPTPPALRRIHNARANEGLLSTERTRKISVAKGPGMHLTRTTVSSSELPKIQHSSIMMQKTKNLERDALNEKNSPDRRTTSHSDFLQQVASRLANEVDNKDTTTASSASISPPDTPMLPTLSPSSSIASFMFSSDSSGTATPVRGHSSRLKVDNRSFRTDNRNDESLTPRRRNRGKIGSGGKSRSANDLESIKTQLESLESMYADVLCLLDEGVTENKSKSTDKNTVVNQEKTEELKAGIMAFRKQRSKDIKSVNKRFGRLESHVVTLARSVAHLSSELRSQAAVNEDLNEMRKEIKRLRTLQEEIESRKSCGVQQSDQYTANLKRINKLRKFFGSEPPLLDNFLKKLGYERFAAKFGSEQIGILELPYLNEERLQSLGIPLGPRLRIVEEALKLRF